MYACQHVCVLTCMRANMYAYAFLFTDALMRMSQHTHTHTQISKKTPGKSKKNISKDAELVRGLANKNKRGKRLSDALVCHIYIYIYMDIHIRLSKKTPGDARSSTRTFLLYLEGCGRGRLSPPLSSPLSSSLVASLLLPPLSPLSYERLRRRCCVVLFPLCY